MMGVLTHLAGGDFAPMCCVLIIKDVFEQIGYLDENYFIYYEDVD